RSRAVTRSTSKSPESDRFSYRGRPADTRPDYYLRYEDQHFGIQVGRPPYDNGYPGHHPGNGWQHHRPPPQQSYPRPYYNTPRQPGTLDPLR
ncbi:MAG: hypothetical protein ACRCWR_07770, partial [Saezia sp.]